MSYGSVNKPRGVSARPTGTAKKVTKLGRVHGSDNIVRTKFNLKKARSTESQYLTGRKPRTISGGTVTKVTGSRTGIKPTAPKAAAPKAAPKLKTGARFSRAKTKSWGGKLPSWKKVKSQAKKSWVRVKLAH